MLLAKVEVQRGAHNPALINIKCLLSGLAFALWPQLFSLLWWLSTEGNRFISKFKHVWTARSLLVSGV